MADSSSKYETTGTTEVLAQQPIGPPPPYMFMPPPLPDGAQYQPAMVPPQQTVIIQNVPTMFGRDPQPAFCPNCRQMVTTEVDYNMGAFGWIMVVVFFFFCICLSCLPCCLSVFKDAYHKCPNCKTFLGKNEIV